MGRGDKSRGFDRAGLISELAESIGITENIDPKYSGSRYDRNTGTFYCDGIPLPHGSMESVREWYRMQMELYRPKASEGGVKRDYFIRYAVAYNAVCFLEDSLKN